MRVVLDDLGIHRPHPRAHDRLRGAAREGVADEGVPEGVEVAGQAELLEDDLEVSEGTPVGNLPAGGWEALRLGCREDPLGRSR
jgi:hypothetical protein